MIEEAVEEAMKAMHQGVILLICPQDGFCSMMEHRPMLKQRKVKKLALFPVVRKNRVIPKSSFSPTSQEDEHNILV